MVGVWWPVCFAGEYDRGKEKRERRTALLRLVGEEMEKESGRESGAREKEERDPAVLRRVVSPEKVKRGIGWSRRRGERERENKGKEMRLLVSRSGRK
ncbi:hypothetical protein HAX54_015372 [Datura stramonium]|uniref:Uncharacterized protein n=1 Tax=Datura stramonium TaxID=4076 RepID=A0ABS8RZL0_DATST|nr:hypothetical protein [Datura stramonium]